MDGQKKPGWHKVKLLADAVGHIVPWVQFWHTDCATNELNVPGTQLIHAAAADCPKLGLNVPTPHNEQLMAPIRLV